jgi:hypothetical protein
LCANFRPGGGASGKLRIPQDLAALVNLPEDVTVRLVLDRQGAQDLPVARLSRQALIGDGFAATVANQSAHVYRIGR